MSRNELPSIFTLTIIQMNRRVLKKRRLPSKGEKMRSRPREKDPVLDSNECENLEGIENNAVDVNFDKRFVKTKLVNFSVLPLMELYHFVVIFIVDLLVTLKL